MRKISFYWIAAFLLAAFVVSMGGCGGGGSNNFSRNEESSGTETPEKTLSSLLVSSDMAGVMHGNEWVDLINEFEESGSGDKMNPHSWVYCITDEEAQKLREEYADDELRLGMLNALLFDADEISRDYAREYDVLLIYPNEDFINRTLEAAGLDSNYVMDSDKGRLELFAIAKRTVNDRTFRFTYQAFRADDAVLVGVRTSEDAELTSADNSAAAGDEDITQSAVTEDDDGGIFFNVGRWRNYYNWCASLTETANESNIEASAIEVRAAADNDLTKIADAQIANLECSYRESGYRPWGGWITGDAANIQRKNQVSVKVYNCHSYSYGKDYYLIQTNATTSPQSFLDREAVFLLDWQRR